MADAEKTDYHTDILPKKESVLDLIRVATYVHQIPVAVDMIKDAHDKGYEVTANLMAVSTVQDTELGQALEVLIETPASTIVVVDSFGSLYTEQIELLVKKYRKAVEGTGKEVGIHAHNNQQLGFANTIEAIIHGCQSRRRDGGWHRTRRRQLPDGAADRLPAQPASTGFARISSCCRTTSSRYARRWNGVRWCPTTSPASSISTRGRPSRIAHSDDKDNYVAFYDKLISDL